MPSVFFCPSRMSGLQWMLNAWWWSLHTKFCISAKEKNVSRLYYRFHLFLALARQETCITFEHRHDAFRYAFPSRHKIKYMPYNNRYCNFMLNWNILDFDGFNRYTHTEKMDVKKTGKCLAISSTLQTGQCYRCCFLRKWVTRTLYDDFKNGSTYAKMIKDILWIYIKWKL